MSGGFDAEAFGRQTNVSCETLLKLEAYAALLVKWQRSINLVSAATLPDLWRRHFLDSAQLAPLTTPPWPASSEAEVHDAGGLVQLFGRHRR